MPNTTKIQINHTARGIDGMDFFPPILNIFIKLEISSLFFEFHLVVFGNVFF